MKFRFEKGDVVVIHKPSNLDQHPKWVRDMDGCDGAVATVHSSYGILRNVCVYVDEFVWEFNQDWLEPLSESTIEINSECLDSLMWGE